MIPSKIGIAALVLVAGISSPAMAQRKSGPGGATGAYPASQADGTGSGYYALYPGAINYGLSGTFPNYGGYGYPGFGPGAQFGAHYGASTGVDAPKKAASPVVNVPASSGDLGGLANIIRKQAGRPAAAKGTTRSRTLTPTPKPH